MRDAEAEEYTGQGGDFTSDESIYRRGFEASLHPMARNASFDEARANLRERHGDVYDADAFRRGYERGRASFVSSFNRASTSPRPKASKTDCTTLTFSLSLINHFPRGCAGFVPGLFSLISS